MADEGCANLHDVQWSVTLRAHPQHQFQVNKIAAIGGIRVLKQKQKQVLFTVTLLLGSNAPRTYRCTIQDLPTPCGAAQQNWNAAC